MELEGSVSQHSVDDLFRVIADSNRDGTLGLHCGGREVMIYFKNGHITYAYMKRKKNRLGERMMHYGVIGPEDLQNALKRQKTEKKRLGQILIESNLTEEEDLHAIIAEQIDDVLHHAISWDDGFFKFYDKQFPTDEPYEMKIACDRFLADIADWRAEMNDLKRRLPDFSRSMMLSRLPSETDRIQLASEEWNLLSLCDGRHTVRDILSVEDEPLTRMKTLLKLYEAGLIECCGVDEQCPQLLCEQACGDACVPCQTLNCDDLLEAVSLSLKDMKNDQDIGAHFVSSLEYQLEAMKRFGLAEKHPLTFLDRLLDRISARTNDAEEHLAASMIYYLRMRGYLMVPYVEKLREARKPKI